MIRITPVFEAPNYEGEPPWPWEISDVGPFTLIAACAESSSAEIGSYFASFASVEGPSDPRPHAELLGDIIENGANVCGGVRFEADGAAICSGCCGDLHELVEWRNFLESGERPWTGHDPSPWPSVNGQELVIWSDGAFEEEQIEPAIRVARNEFEKELNRASHSLAAFAQRCKNWLSDNQIPEAGKIGERIVADFKIK